MVSQVVVPDFPYEQIALQEAVLQQGSAQPIQLGPAMLARARASSVAPLTRLVVDGCSGSELVGQEEVTVPAGTFATSHYRNAGAGSDIWVSREVPFGIVKLTGRDGASMELMGHGKDARSSLSGEPRVVNGAN